MSKRRRLPGLTGGDMAYFGSQYLPAPKEPHRDDPEFNEIMRKWHHQEASLEECRQMIDELKRTRNCQRSASSDDATVAPQALPVTP